MSSFLNVKPFTKGEKAERERDLGNWMRIAKIIYATKDPELVVRYLQLELSGQPREFIVARLYTRFSALRVAQERNDFFSQFKANKPEQSAKLDAILDKWTETMVYLSNQRNDLSTALMTLMAYEYHQRRRNYVLHRLYTRYCTERRNVERRELNGERKSNRGLLSRASAADRG